MFLDFHKFIFPLLCPLRSKIEGTWIWFCLSFCPPLWIFNLENNFWIVSTRALRFQMSISCDKTFQWVPLFFTLWPWPWTLTHFLKTLSLLITFEQWVQELWCFTWVFLLTRPFCGFPVTLALEFDPFFENFTLVYNLWTGNATAFIFHMSISCDKTFLRVPLFFTLWPWPMSLTYFLKTLNLLFTI